MTRVKKATTCLLKSMQCMKQTDFLKNAALGKNKPIAAKMTPLNFEEFVGQDNIAGDGKLLCRSIETDNLGSVIFWASRNR